MNIVAIVGRLSQMKQMRKLNNFLGKTIIVAAPIRLWKTLSKNSNDNENKSLSNAPNNLEHLIID